MRARSLPLCLLTAGAVAAGCATDPGPPTQADGGTGGSAQAATGGTSAGAPGGAVASGGAGTGGTPGTGGTLVSAGGASPNHAGAPGTGGAGAAGAPGHGGVPSTGGMPGAGGGGANTAGTANRPAGGMSGGGGVKAGGAAGNGGAAVGGSPAGGRAGLGGAAGANMAGGPSTEMCPVGSHNGQGTQHCGMSDSGTADGNYTYNIYSDGKGSGCMTTYGVDATFSATWTNVGDWIARVGLAFDKTKTYDQIGVFSSDINYTTTGVTSGGFGNIGIYGWSVNPLHEYYIIEDWLGKRPNFTQVDTLTIDGEGTYEIQSNTQNNQPNITGTNATFVQFWSVRTTPRHCGHISISKHFDKWKSVGLTLGNLEEARILVEAQNNSGAIDFTTGTVVVTK